MGEAKRKEHSAWRKQQRIAGSGQIAAGRKQEPEDEAEDWQLGNWGTGQLGRKRREPKGKLAGGSWQLKARLGNWAIWQLGDAGRKEQSAER